MTDGTEVQQHTTGDACPRCEREVLILVGEEDELHVECDCGATLALGPSTSSLADAA